MSTNTDLSVREDGCLCRDCNFRFKVDFNLPDDLWDKIEGGGALCGLCIVERLELLDDFDSFDLTRTP